MARKRRKHHAGHETFFEKLAIAVVTAAATAGTTEAVKNLNEKPAVPPTVVIVERESGASSLSSPLIDPTDLSRVPSGSPPTQKGSLLFTDESGAGPKQKPFEMPGTLFTDFFLTSVQPGSEPVDAVRLDLKTDGQSAFSFMVDRTNLSIAMDKYLSDSAKVHLEKATRLTLDLKGDGPKPDGPRVSAPAPKK